MEIHSHLFARKLYQSSLCLEESAWLSVLAIVVYHMRMTNQVGSAKLVCWDLA
jgi:hypothetical protein